MCLPPPMGVRAEAWTLARGDGHGEEASVRHGRRGRAGLRQTDIRRPLGGRSLAGRVAVVTGASSGIGLATATALAGAGARLVLVARSESRLHAAAKDVARIAGGGPPALVLPCDVSDAQAVLAMAD